jgi:glutamate N-acetyltransferase/amino-acid N-acetyltransferase
MGSCCNAILDIIANWRRPSCAMAGGYKFITIAVEGGKNLEECRKVKAPRNSPFTTGENGVLPATESGANFGGGGMGINDLDQTRIDNLDDVLVAKTAPSRDYEADGQRVMKQSEITVRVVLGRRTASDTVWTCDLS